VPGSTSNVARRPLDGSADGWCDYDKRETGVNSELPANAQVRVLVHEIAHALDARLAEDADFDVADLAAAAHPVDRQTQLADSEVR
jgi:hypothetical protein